MKKVITYPSLPSIKIGGMGNKEKRIPLYGSVRFCVTGRNEPIYTCTTSELSQELQENEVYINQEKMEGKPKQRVETLFNELTKLSDLKGKKFRLESENIGYPTGGGLASSAAGLAASALSLYESIREYNQDFYMDKKDISRIARLGSSSAIGSVIGSFSELIVTEDDAWGEKIADEDALEDLSISIALIEGGEESDQIHRAMEKSRYRNERMNFVRKAIPQAKRAILENDVIKFIECTHEDTKNYHGAILDQGLLTFEAQTIPIFRKVEELRKENINVGLSIAGGPIPIILTTKDEKDYVLSGLSESLRGIKLIDVKIAGEPKVI